MLNRHYEGRCSNTINMQCNTNYNLSLREINKSLQILIATQHLFFTKSHYRADTAYTVSVLLFVF